MHDIFDRVTAARLEHRENVQHRRHLAAEPEIAEIMHRKYGACEPSERISGGNAHDQIHDKIPGGQDSGNKRVAGQRREQ